VSNWSYTVLSYGAILIVWGCFVGVAYFILPSKWRKGQLWCCLPAATSVLSLCLGIPILFDSAVGDHSSWHMFYMVLNLPAMLLLLAVDKVGWLHLAEGSGRESGATLVVASILWWILLTSPVGWLIDRRRRRKGLASTVVESPPEAKNGEPNL
jgi:hypothetical protein